MRKEILHQYANSPKLLKIIDTLANAILADKSAKDFYDDVYNIKTAIGFGLDRWGVILNTSRNIELDGEPYTMDDDIYRLVLMLKGCKNVSNGSCPDIARILQFLFGDKGEIFVSDYGDMTMRYTFNFLLGDTLLAIMQQKKILPVPAGVGVEIYELPNYEVFGFNGQGLSNFNNGTFFQGKRGL